MGLLNLSLESKIDKDIINKIAEGDKNSFDILYENSRNIVFSIALSITGSPEDASDIVQETYIKVLEKANTYNNMGKPIAWVCTIARNLSLTSIKKNKRQDNIDRFEDDIRVSKIENKDDKLILKSALSILNSSELEIVLLHNAGLKFREISDMQGISLSTILSKYKRSLDKMRKHLETNDGGVI